MRKQGLGLAVAATLMAGCATSSDKISSAYVSPMAYQNYDCAQLAAEGQRLVSRVTEIGGKLDNEARNDKVAMGVGLVLFWPALFFLGGDKGKEAEFSRLKGEYEAVQQTAISKKCTGAVG